MAEVYKGKKPTTGVRVEQLGGPFRKVLKEFFRSHGTHNGGDLYTLRMNQVVTISPAQMTCFQKQFTLDVEI